MDSEVFGIADIDAAVIAAPPVTVNDGLGRNASADSTGAEP
jgi:hypothetical protein